MKHSTSDKQDGTTLIPSLLEHMPDISSLLQFISNEPVYHKIKDAQFPSLLKEATELFVGIS
jgi:hypothetical protein